uniref:Ependymin n=2 Tax=Neogobius melanostomus TaxID=47308 RepID=A0A8C6S8A4_9GOBI
MRLVLLLLACLLGLSLGASLERKPHHCKSPPLLTGAFTFATQNEKAWAYGGYEYDAMGERIRIFEVGTYDKKNFTYNALLLYREGVMYEINDQAKTCKKNPLQTDFKPFGVPANATLLGQAVIGSSSGPGQGLLVNSWTGQFPNGVKYMMTMTAFGCIPVSYLYQTKEFGWVSVSYINNVMGIVDPGALNPPPFCSGLEVQPEGKPVDFFTVIENMRNAP